MAATGKPMLMSTGMSGYAEIEAMLGKLRGASVPVAVLQCTSRYPTSLTEVGLNVIDELRERFACPAGLSDHSGVVFPALLALAKGADIVEAHITLNRRRTARRPGTAGEPRPVRLPQPAREGLL